MIFLWSPFDVKRLDCKMWCFPCACACVLRARITPVIVFFCCHICHTRGRKGWKKAKKGELKIVKTRVFGVHNEQNNDCDRDCLSNLTKHQMQQREIQSITPNCDRCDSKKHITPVRIRVRAHARGRMIRIFTHQI